ncbi:MAG: CCA tRNA nucleotidyltransferase [Candidatus Methylomirabilia bacterium]
MLAEALEILREILARGRCAVIVGGAVRDLVLGRPLTDVDLATDMPLDELSSLFKTYAVGRSVTFDTVVITRGGHAFEISRFRGRGQQRERPDDDAPPGERFDPLREDTAHRDFTVNALLMGLDGEVIDLQGGLDDLRNRLVRCVGSPEERLAEDPVRILRAVRFAACLGFRIEGGTAAAIAGCAPLLAGVAGERIGKEILKIASQPGAALAAALTLMERFGLLGLLLPEVGDLRGLPQPIEWHPEGDAWEHTLAALRSSASADPAVNLAVLLHDVGKHPAHREVAGRHHYRGHESAGGKIADTVARRLHLPQRQREAIAFAVENHMRTGRLAELRRSKTIALLASPHWPVLRSLGLCDIAARGDETAVARLEAAFREAEADAAAELEARAGAPVISGSRIMELTGLAPGPRVGEIRRRVGEWALDNRVEDRARIEAEVARAAGLGSAEAPGSR